MQDEDRDLAYLWDMREEARNIVSFVKDISYDHFAQNTLVRYAVERSLMIIGEAANHISENYKEKHPEIAWRQIIGQRNVLAHEYGDINFERIWHSAFVSVPVLLEALERLLSNQS